LDKLGYKGRSICGDNFCLELLFGPPDARCSMLSASEDEDEDEDEDESIC